jgi:hypothetical protein
MQSTLSKPNVSLQGKQISSPGSNDWNTDAGIQE